MKSKVHYHHAFMLCFWDGVVLCGIRPKRSSSDPTQVTCKRCQVMIEKRGIK